MHRSAIKSLIFYENDTKIASGSADTYIIIYDLLSDSALFKLIGHNEQITQMAIFTYSSSTKGNEQDILISASKDGLLKLWDLEKQSCILTTSD